MGFLLAAIIRCIIYCSFSFPLMSFCYYIVYFLLKSFFVEGIFKSKSNIIYLNQRDELLIFDVI